MNRRSFLAGVGGISMIPTPAAIPKPKYYRLDQFVPRQTGQLGPPHYVPLPKPVLLLQALVAPHMPSLASLSGVDSIQAYWQGQYEPRIGRYWTSLLEEAPGCPGIETLATSTRIFELRVYQSPAWRQLAALHRRLTGPEMTIFHRAGVHPILHTAFLSGPDKPNLTYLIPFASLAAREKAWNAFAADKEWIQLREQLVLRHGGVPGLIQIAIYIAADYTPPAATLPHLMQRPSLPP